MGKKSGIGEIVWIWFLEDC